MALQTELIRLGYSVTPTGLLTQEDIDAFSGLDGGAASSALEIARDSIVWLPEPTVRIQACPAHLGQTISGDVTVAEVPGGLDQISTTPGQSDRGELDLLIGQATIPLPSTGVVTDAADLLSVEQTPEFQAWKESQGALDLTATVRLRTPIPVLEVPASSVIIDSGRTCVLSGSVTREVTVVASILGRSLLANEVDLEEVVVFPSREQRCA